MTVDCADCAPLDMGNDSRLSIKQYDGTVVRVPVSVKGKSLVIYNYPTIQNLVNIFEQGNFKISIQNAIDMNDGADQTYNVTVKGDSVPMKAPTRTIKHAETFTVNWNNKKR